MTGAFKPITFHKRRYLPRDLDWSRPSKASMSMGPTCTTLNVTNRYVVLRPLASTDGTVTRRATVLSADLRPRCPSWTLMETVSRLDKDLGVLLMHDWPQSKALIGIDEQANLVHLVLQDKQAPRCRDQDREHVAQRLGHWEPMMRLGLGDFLSTPTITADFSFVDFAIRRPSLKQDFYWLKRP